MNKKEYLKLAIKANAFAKKSWIISALSITFPKQKEKYEHLEIIPEPWGYSVWLDNGGREGDVYENPNTGEKEYMELITGGKVKIEDAVQGQPLFHVKDRFIVDNSWFTNVTEPKETQFGNILFNAICVYPAFGSRIPFQFGKVSMENIDGLIAAILLDTPEEGKPRSKGNVYCDELMRFQDSKEHFKSVAHLLNQAATIKTITKSPEFEAFRNKLAKEYGDQLKDPVKLVEFEKKLQAFDNEWLKGDPADDTFMVGKVRNVGRKKMFLSIGSEPGFETKSTVNPIITSLDDGWSHKPQDHVDTINGIRHASLSRGKETVKGGVTAKYLLRAGNNFSIINQDCGAKNGINIKYDEKQISKLIGRSILTSQGTVKIDTKEQASEYSGKYVRLRSPAYCTVTGDRICKVCAGDGLALNPNGIAIALTEVSSIVMTDFMKAMHDTTIKTTRLVLDEIFS